jgi:hypothetical protein
MTTTPRRRIRARLTLAVAIAAPLVGAGCAEAADPAPAPAPAAASAPAPEIRAPEPEPAQDPGPKMDFARILAEVVTPDGLVHYDKLGEPARLAALNAEIARLGSMQLPADRDERMALWCNAYNANVLAMALAESRKPGFESVVKVPGFFDARKITVCGESLTLNALENQRIRPLGDPRIHAALVCAAVSCPPLRAEPYMADRLDEQFSDQCKRWVNDPTKFRIEDGRLGLSEILNWYGSDFDAPPYGSPVGFVLAYAKPAGEIARYVVNNDPARTTWLTYDWALNRAPGAAGKRTP